MNVQIKPCDPTFLAALDRRHRFYEGITTAFRAVHRGEIASIECAIDVYGDFLCVWDYEDTHSENARLDQLRPYISYLQRHYNTQGWVWKQIGKDPHRKRWVKAQRVFGEIPPYFTVIEHGLTYEVTLTERQHVGLFLDQRENRRRVMQSARDLRVANLFAYSCSFSVAAVAGGAEIVFSVDVSKAALALGKRNFELNGLSDLGRGKFIEADVRQWLDKQLKRKTTDATFRPLDLIICDPPTFSTTEAGVFSVKEGWEELVSACRHLLTANGSAYFSTNYQSQDRDYFKTVLARYFRHVTSFPPPVDFPSLPGRPDTVTLFYCTCD